MPRRVLDDVETERRLDRRGPHFDDPPAETTGLCRDLFEHSQPFVLGSRDRPVQQVSLKQRDPRPLPSHPFIVPGGRRCEFRLATVRRLVPVTEPVPLHAIAKRVPRQTEPRRGSGEVAPFDAQGILDAPTFERRHLLIDTLCRPRSSRHTWRTRETQGCRPTCSASDSNATRSITLASSRTLPGQGYASRAACASNERVLIGRPYSRQARSR